MCPVISIDLGDVFRRDVIWTIGTVGELREIPNGAETEIGSL